MLFSQDILFFSNKYFIQSRILFWTKKKITYSFSFLFMSRFHLFFPYVSSFLITLLITFVRFSFNFFSHFFFFKNHSYTPDTLFYTLRDKKKKERNAMCDKVTRKKRKKRKGHFLYITMILVRSIH